MELLILQYLDTHGASRPSDIVASLSSEREDKVRAVLIHLENTRAVSIHHTGEYVAITAYGSALLDRLQKEAAAEARRSRESKTALYISTFAAVTGFAAALYSILAYYFK